MFNPRGKSVFKRWNSEAGSCLAPRIIAYVKVGSRNMLDQFRKCIKHLGLVVEMHGNIPIPVQDFGGYLAAFDVGGHPDALAAFTDHDCVDDWHALIGSRCFGGGGHGEKPKPQPRPMEQRFNLAVQARMRNDIPAAQQKDNLTTKERCEAIGI